MKTFLSLLLSCFLALSSCSSSKGIQEQSGINDGPTIITISAEGNLESFNPIEKCVGIDGVSTQNTPADILPASILCVNQDDYEKAVKLSYLARVYAFYDMKRVSDGSAHQAIFMLEEQTFSSLSENNIQKIQSAFQLFSDPNSKKSQELCSELKMLGPPEYHPTYMIQHGLGAIMNTEGN